MHKRPMIRNSRDLTPLRVLGTDVRFLCEGDSTGDAWSLMEVTLPQNAGPPPHEHQWDEAYFILDGDVQFTVGDQEFMAAPGDFIYTPGSVVHGFRGASLQPARLLILDAPAHASAFFKRVDREVTQLPRDLPKVIQIGKETGIHFAKPG